MIQKVKFLVNWIFSLLPLKDYVDAQFAPNVGLGIHVLIAVVLICVLLAIHLISIMKWQEINPMVSVDIIL